MLGVPGIIQTLVLLPACKKYNKTVHRLIAGRQAHTSESWLQLLLSLMHRVTPLIAINKQRLHKGIRCSVHSCERAGDSCS